MLFTNRNDIRRTSGSFLGWLKAVGRMLMYAMRVISVLIGVYLFLNTVPAESARKVQTTIEKMIRV